MLQTKVAEKIKHILRPQTFFFEHRAVYVTMWNNMVQPQTTI
jgi:hypothetical protein